jgi:predicted nucleic acid-binding protein
MRALLDANVYISFLLTHGEATPPRITVDAALDGAYQLLMTAGVISEVRRKTATKPYLARRIEQTVAERLVRRLMVIAEVIPELDPPLPEVGRDRKDNYFFAQYLVGDSFAAENQALPMQSWASKSQTAKNFAYKDWGYIARASIDVRQIVSTGVAGFGTGVNEHEFIVLAGDGSVDHKVHYRPDSRKRTGKAVRP